MRAWILWTLLGFLGTSTLGCADGANAIESDAEASSAQPPLNPRAVLVIEEAAGQDEPQYLVTMTDYAQTTELAVVGLDTKSVLNTELFEDGDAVPAAGGGRAFVLERTNDRVHLLAGDATLAKTIDMAGKPSESDPGEKAYVALYNSNHLAVVDLDSAELTGEIDVSEFAASDDSDGFVDIDSMVLDENGIAYVLLSRIDQNLFEGSGLACIESSSLIVAIDTDTDELVELGGEASVPLQLAGAQNLVLDREGQRLLSLGAGCIESGARVRQGVEAVSLLDFSTTVLLKQPYEDLVFTNLLLQKSGDLLINAFDYATYAYPWFLYDPETDELGEPLDGTPEALVDGAGAGLFGLLAAEDMSGFNVVSYDLAGHSESVVDSPFTAGLPLVSGGAFVNGPL